MCVFYPHNKRKRTPKAQPQMANPEKYTVHKTQYYHKSQKKSKIKKDNKKNKKQKQKSVIVLIEQILILFVIHVVIF